MNDARFSKADQLSILEIMKARRDVRGNRFMEQPVTKDELDLILEAAFAAPSVGLSEPWQFVIIDSDEIKERVYQNCCQAKQEAEEGFIGDQLGKYRDLKLEGIKEAPLNIAVYYNPPQEKIIGNNTMKEVGEYSVVCAIQNMWLMARSLNIGMGWVSILNPEQVSELLKVPRHMKLVGYLCLGHVEAFLDRPELEALEWQKRRERQDFLHQNRFESRVTRQS